MTKVKAKNPIKLMTHINKPIFDPKNVKMCKIVFNDTGKLDTRRGESCPYYKGGGLCGLFNDGLQFSYPTKAYRSKNCLSCFEVENES